jgi:hypothetical protein
MCNPHRQEAGLSTHTDSEIAAKARFNKSGLSLVLPDFCYMLDVDDVINEAGIIDPRAGALVAELDSYTEVSPSGRGLHIIVSAPGFHASMNPTIHTSSGLRIEIKRPGTYITFTGNYIRDTEIKDTGDCIMATYEAYYRSRPPIKSHDPDFNSPEKPKAYYMTALQGEVDKVRAAAEGNRSNTLFSAALRLRKHIGPLSNSEIVDALSNAARLSGLTENEGRRTVASGLRHRGPA